MTAKIYIPALAVIVILLSIMAGIMIHTHDRRAASRAYYRNSNNQALAASCLALRKGGVTGAGLAGCPPPPITTTESGN